MSSQPPCGNSCARSKYSRTCTRRTAGVATAPAAAAWWMTRHSQCRRTFRQATYARGRSRVSRTSGHGGPPARAGARNSAMTDRSRAAGMGGSNGHAAGKRRSKFSDLTLQATFDSYTPPSPLGPSGGVAEWSKAAVLKTAERKLRGFESLLLRRHLDNRIVSRRWSWAGRCAASGRSRPNIYGKQGHQRSFAIVGHR